MGIATELRFDQDRCENCNCVLAENIASKRPVYRLYRHDGTLYDAQICRVVCANCGYANRIFFYGEPLAEFDSFEGKAEFGCVQAI